METGRESLEEYYKNQDQEVTSKERKKKQGEIWGIWAINFSNKDFTRKGMDQLCQLLLTCQRS